MLIRLESRLKLKGKFSDKLRYSSSIGEKKEEHFRSILGNHFLVNGF